MEQRGLKVLEADKTFFTKLTTTISKLLIPTKVGINGLLISMKRNNLLKAYESYAQGSENEENVKKEQNIKKYEEAYSLYLESIDKYIMDSVYKKVRAGSASTFEADAMSKYYQVVALKEQEYVEYKHRKQKYLLELDYETIINLNKEKLVEKYQPFYIAKMDQLYKGILKNYSICLADANVAKFGTNIEIYEKIFATLEEYVRNILPIKMQLDQENNYHNIAKEKDAVERFEVGKLDEKDQIEKKMLLLGISRSLFTHSLPLMTAQQCYIQLLKDTRSLIIHSKNQKKEQEAYQLLITLIEEYNVKLLSTKVYWDKPEERNQYKKFWDEYKKIITQKENKNAQKEKEILFLKADLKQISHSKKNYSKVIAFYKKKLVEYGAMRTLSNHIKTEEGKWSKKLAC